MNEVQVFNFDNSEVRIVIMDNAVWFCLEDVCKILELSNPTVVMSRLNENGRTKFNLGRQGEADFINENNLYKVIFQSRTEQAEQFTDYVTSEVIPSIRKHGAYMTEQTIESVPTDPDFLIKLAMVLKEERKKVKQLEIQNSLLVAENQTMIPKAQYFDELVDRNILTNIRETAKEFKIKEKDFINFMLDKKYLYRDRKGKLVPYAKTNKGLFEVKECFSKRTEWKGIQTLITPRGRETLRILIQNHV